MNVKEPRRRTLAVEMARHEPESLEIETNWARRTKRDRQRRIAAMLEDIRRTRQPLAGKAPWEIDRILEQGSDRRQLEMFTEGQR